MLTYYIFMAFWFLGNYSAKEKGVEDLPDRLAESKYGI